jgi:hypothetical protein
MIGSVHYFVNALYWRGKAKMLQYKMATKVANGGKS